MIVGKATQQPILELSAYDIIQMRRFGMSHIMTAIYLLPLALLISMVVYLPIFFVLRKKSIPCNPLRHAFNICSICYMIVLFLIVFSGGRTAAYGRALNISPLKETLFYTYAHGEKLVNSQFMLNIFMFVPLGFLLPLVINKKSFGFIATLFSCLGITLTIEFIQYIIGRVADIDDVIANTLGGIVGFCIFAIVDALLKKLRLYRSIRGIVPYPPYACTAFALVAAFILIAPFAADKAYYGTDRVGIAASMMMPHDAQVLMNDYDFAQSAMLYSLSEIDISAVFAEAAERLTGERFDLRKSADGMLEGELCGKRLSVFDDGRWTYSFFGAAPMGESLISDEECIKAAKRIVEHFLESDEIISNVKTEICDIYGNASHDTALACKRIVLTIEKEPSNLSTWPQKQTDGNATVILASDCVISYMNFDVLRYEASRMIEIMPPTAAVERAKRFGYRLSGYSNMVISDVALSYTRIAAKKQLIPIYFVTLSATRNATGNRYTWKTIINGAR